MTDLLSRQVPPEAPAAGQDNEHRDEQLVCRQMLFDDAFAGKDRFVQQPDSPLQLTSSSRQFKFELGGDASTKIEKPEPLAYIARDILRQAASTPCIEPSATAVQTVADRLAAANGMQSSDSTTIGQEIKIRWDLIQRKQQSERLPTPHSDIVYSAGASEAFVNDVTAWTKKLSPEVQQLLKDKDLKVVAAGDMRDTDPSQITDVPRGWEWPSSWAQVTGLFRTEQKEIVVHERTLQDGYYLPSKGPEGAMLHETGHALNWALGYFSETPEFIEAHNKDVAAMSAQDNQTLHYLIGDEIQDQMAARDECFAEVFAGSLGSGTMEVGSEFVVSRFPNVLAAIKDRFSKLPQEMPGTGR